MIKFLKNLLSGQTMSWQQRQIERYLADSTDLIDLERRQKELTFGKLKF